MNNHPTSISLTTRTGSRRAVPWVNHPGYRRKGEPGQRRGCACTSPRIVTPWAKSGTPLVPVELNASLLLVILHYLLKNITTFMDEICAGQCVSPDSNNVAISTGGHMR